MKLFADAVELIGDVDSAERCEALIGLGRGAAPERRCRLPRDAARGVADRLRARGCRARRARGTGEQPRRCLERVRRDRPGAACRRSSGRSSSMTRRIRAPRALLLALQAHGAASGTRTSHASLRARRRGGLAGSRRGRREDARRSSAPRGLRVSGLRIRSSCEAHSRKELSDCADAVRDPALQFWAHNMELLAYVERGELARAEAALERMQRIAEELGQPTLKWFATYQTAALELLRGDLAAGERLAERAFADRAGGGTARRRPGLRWPAFVCSPLPGPGQEIIPCSSRASAPTRVSRPCAPPWPRLCAGLTVESRRPQILEKARATALSTFRLDRSRCRRWRCMPTPHR